MRIYYFGELVEDTKNPEIKIKKQQQTALELDSAAPQKTMLERIDDLLQDIDLSLDVYRPQQKVLQ